MKFIVFEAPQLSNKQAEIIILFVGIENNSENFNQNKSFEKIVADKMSNYNITNFFCVIIILKVHIFTKALNCANNLRLSFSHIHTHILYNIHLFYHNQLQKPLR